MVTSSTSGKLTDEQWNGIAVLGEAIAKSGVSAQEFADALGREMAMVEKAAAFAEFLSGPAAPEITASIVNTSGFLQREDILPAARDALLTLAELHRNGTLSALRNWSGQISAARESIDLDSIADDAMPGMVDNGATRIGDLLKAVEQATDEADNDRRHLGGISGLLHMLRDPEVQHGMRTLMVLPGYLRRADPK
jgi:uncharacterized protein YjgD (DUF1641 family)